MPTAKQIDAGAFSPDIRDFIRCLHKHAVRHLIVGGNAVIFHGFIRYTGDIDFFYEDTAGNREALWQALKDRRLRCAGLIKPTFPCDETFGLGW